MNAFKLLLSGLILSFFCTKASGQSLGKDSLFIPDQLRQYQFQLEEPVQSIQNLRYEKSNEEIKGILTPDGKRVIMENYKKGQKVKLDLIHSDGRKETISKSPCFIDPVTFEL